MSASLVRATVRAVSKRKLQPTRAALTLVSEAAKERAAGPVTPENREARARGSLGGCGASLLAPVVVRE